jgi:hypothetical protein
MYRLYQAFQTLRPLQPNSISEKAHAPRDKEFEILPEICVACNNLQTGRFGGVGYVTVLRTLETARKQKRLALSAYPPIATGWQTCRPVQVCLRSRRQFGGARASHSIEPLIRLKPTALRMSALCQRASNNYVSRSLRVGPHQRPLPCRGSITYKFCEPAPASQSRLSTDQYRSVTKIL